MDTFGIVCIRFSCTFFMKIWPNENSKLKYTEWVGNISNIGLLVSAVLLLWFLLVCDKRLFVFESQ
jgi:hypothetical protein